MFPRDDTGPVGVMLFLFIITSLLKNVVCVSEINVSDDEYLQMNAYLKSLTKPAVMSIQTEYGDIYDCVDIYKQPAFDHPSLKNHTIQMKPTSYPKEIRKNNTKSRVQSDGLKGGGCPSGTVPIKRAQIQDLLLANSLSHYGRKNAVARDGASHDYATVTALPGGYYGARGVMNVWHPTPHEPDSFSLSQIWLSSGPDYDLNTIEVGWVVYPKFSGPETRLFVSWTADSYRKTGCHNLLCPGFVQLNQLIPVDTPLVQVSTYNGQQHEIQIDIFKDPRSGNWFLSKDGLTIGYWPMSIFNSLSTEADRVEWGGEVALRNKSAPLPSMGSGHFPEEGYGKAAYIRELQVIDDNTRMTLKDAKGCTPYTSVPHCYKVELNPNGKGKLADNHFLFGGPGGQCR